MDSPAATTATVVEERPDRAGRRSEHGSSADAYERREREADISRALALLPPEMQRRLADPRSVISPLVIAEKAKEMEQAFQALCEAVLTDDDYAWYAVQKQKVVNGNIVEYVANEKRKRKSAWRKLGRYVNIDVDLTKEVIGHVHNEQNCARIVLAKHGLRLEEGEDCGCPTVYARYHFRVTGWNGRVGRGIGIASRNERGFKAQDHSIPATAYSRGLSRAISDLIGAGESSADDPETTVDAPKGEAQARPSEDVRPLTQDQVKAYTEAWTSSSDDQHRQVRAFLREQGYADNFLATGARDWDRVMELLGAKSAESAPQ